jgi:POT family proton-dependent oligopeptide transporter
MTDTAKGGLGFERKEASDVFGTFIALVFLTPFIGGLLADRVLGYRTSITIGGILMGIGYMSLAIPGQTMFYVSLMLIIVGNGFFKPNIYSPGKSLQRTQIQTKKGCRIQHILHGD